MGEALNSVEKMAALGKQAAGLAHELNNPLAAAIRAAETLRESIQNSSQLMWKISRLQLSEEQMQMLSDAQDRLLERSPQVESGDFLSRSDQEEDLIQWMEEHQILESWKMVQALSEAGLDRDWLDQVEIMFGSDALQDILAWLLENSLANELIGEVEHSTRRMSELVKAMRISAYQDQKPQEVDVHAGLENSLIILNHKMKERIKLVREYSPDLPPILAYGSELSQVWTNLIDNSIDALGGSGTIWVRTYPEESAVVVEIADDGPGIPPEILPHIFEPFFTTKEAGKGTGLGLDISYRIVVDRHQGEMNVDSRPGDTRFRVRLPVKGSRGTIG